jgi:hypothetical protein
LQDIVFSQCELLIQKEFEKIIHNYSLFLKTFNATKYIKENEPLGIVDPKSFVAIYQKRIDSELKIAIASSHRILLNKKYNWLTYLNSERFYNIYSKFNIETFDFLDRLLAGESDKVRSFIIEQQSECNMEMH